MSISGIGHRHLAQVAAELVKEGVLFTAELDQDDWTITFTGGY